MMHSEDSAPPTADSAGNTPIDTPPSADESPEAVTVRQGIRGAVRRLCQAAFTFGVCYGSYEVLQQRAPDPIQETRSDPDARNYFSGLPDGDLMGVEFTVVNLEGKDIQVKMDHGEEGFYGIINGHAVFAGDAMPSGPLAQALGMPDDLRELKPLVQKKDGSIRVALPTLKLKGVTLCLSPKIASDIEASIDKATGLDQTIQVMADYSLDIENPMTKGLLQMMGIPLKGRAPVMLKVRRLNPPLLAMQGA